MRRQALVGITATKTLQEKLAQGFSSIGMETSVVCEMKIEKTKQIFLLKEALKNLSDYQWIGFTSQNGVNLFFEVCEEVKKENPGQSFSFKDVKFAVIGSGTKKKLEEYGYHADFMPDSYTVVSFAEGLCEKIQKGENILLPRAAKGSPQLSEILSLHHISYAEIPIYDVVGILTENVHKLSEMDYLVFVSAQGVEAFSRNDTKQLPKQVKIACIGEVTAEQAKKTFGRVDLVAKVNDVAGLVESVAADYNC